MKSHNNSYFEIKFNTPARYKLKIKGILEDHWGESLGGLQIISVNYEEDTTNLEGILKDQAELSGVLDTLYTLHIPIISVESIKI